MAASPAGAQPESLACTPAAIRAVLVSHAGPGVVQQFDQDVDAAFLQAEQGHDLTPFVRTIRRWWLDASRRLAEAPATCPDRVS